MGSWDDWLTFHPFHFSDPVLAAEVGIKWDGYAALRGQSMGPRLVIVRSYTTWFLRISIT